MQAILRQRNFLVQQIFEITDTSVKVIIKSPASSFEGEFKFEDIGTWVVRVKKQHIPSLIGALIMFGVTALFFALYLTGDKENPWYYSVFCLAGLLFFVFMAYFLFENNTKLYLHNGKFISFYGSSPNRDEVEDFLEVLKSTQKAYLLDRYAKDDPYLTQEQMSNNLTWLFNSAIINNDELANLRKKLLTITTPESTIGFKPENRNQ